nr:disease resistance protein RGA2-like [Ziziphus jujuba var. spinosa]
MAEAGLSSITEGITGQLGKAAVKEIALLWGVKDELHQLEDTIKTIKSVLADAEKKQMQSEQIKTWLERLEDAVYEAHDLVDEFSTEDLRRQVMTGNIMAKQVRTFFSTKNQLAFRHKMGKKIRDLTKKLDKIAEDRHKFNLDVDLQETHVVTSTVRVQDVVGLDDEKMKIIKLLFEMKTEENIGIIPIVGVGGLGKTTLARQVIKDVKVKDHFKPIVWVDVPKVFDVESIVKEIIYPGVKDERKMYQLQNEIEEKIKGKRYLLVLDDVWGIENREKWLELENLLRDGASGSRIIVTTRNKMIAQIINGPEGLAHFLGTLDEDKSWSLFKKLAFMQGQEPNDPNLLEIGKAIMNKCGGIPLVIRTIAIFAMAWVAGSWLSRDWVAGFSPSSAPTVVAGVLPCRHRRLLWWLVVPLA